jgi:hypothetical protein
MFHYHYFCGDLRPLVPYFANLDNILFFISEGAAEGERPVVKIATQFQGTRKINLSFTFKKEFSICTLNCLVQLLLVIYSRWLHRNKSFLTRHYALSSIQQLRYTVQQLLGSLRQNSSHGNRSANPGRAREQASRYAQRRDVGFVAFHPFIINFNGGQ